MYEIKNVPIDSVIPYENNPRNNDASVGLVANSLREFGWKQPIVVDRNMVVVAGHTRLKAAQQLGMDEVPVIIADDLTDEQVRAYRLADNKTNEAATWNIPALDLELMNIEIDMSKFGFEVQEVVETKNPDTGESKSYPIASMDIKAFEHHDYLVFVFDNVFDWENVVSRFDIKKIDYGYEKKKVGVGMVLDGRKLIEALGD